MDFWTNLFLLSALSPSQPAKSKEQRIYDRRIKKARSYSERYLSRLSPSQQEELDLPVYIEDLADKFGIRDDTADLVVEEAGFLSHKAGLIAQETAPLFFNGKPGSRLSSFDDDFSRQLAHRYRLPLSHTKDILRGCYSFWEAAAPAFLSSPEPPTARQRAKLHAFLDVSLRKGSFYPITTWEGGFTDWRGGSLERASLETAFSYQALIALFLDEMAHRDLGFAAGTKYPLPRPS